MNTFIVGMVFFKRVFFLLALGCAFCSTVRPCFCEPSQKVLLIHSFHSEFKWTADITASIKEGLSSHHIDLRVEYLDAKRYASAEYLSLQKLYLKEKYSFTQFSTIICADNTALLFVLHNRTDLFPNIPIVFCGVNSYSKEITAGHSNITGVAENIDIEKTINLMLSQHTSAERIVVINDHTVSGTIFHLETKKIASKFPHITWSFPEFLDFKELQDLLQTLSSTDLVLLGMYFRDINNRSIEYDEVARTITTHSAVPVYAVADYFLGYGIVGGFLTSGRAQGKKAADLVANIFSGAQADDLPVITTSPNGYYADMQQLEKHNLLPSDFPPSTIFINTKNTLYQQYKYEVWSAALLFVLLTVFSIYLAFTVLKKRVAEQKLLKLTNELELRVSKRTADLKKANEDILMREQQMQHLLSNLNGMAYRCLYDEHWTMIFISDGVEQLTGYSQEELINNATIAYADIIDPRDQQMVNDAVVSALEKREHFTIEYRIVKKNGEIHWVWEQGLADFDANGEIRFLDGFITSISERKKIEQEQAKLATAVHQTDDIIIITNLQGIVEYVNPAFENITLYSAQEVIGKTPGLLKSHNHDDMFYKNMWATLLKGNVWKGRIINQKKDGSEYIAESTITPLRNLQGEATHYVNVQHDITSQITLEKKLQQAQKLEAMGTLAGGIAHEINTPAQFVGSNISFTLESMPDLSQFIELCRTMCHADDGNTTNLSSLSALYEENDIEYLLEEIPLALQQSQEGIERISHIVHSMKQFAHPGEDTKSPCNINDAIRNTATVCSNEWKYVATISFNLSDSLPEVPCHRSEINQVLLNIIVNAAHAIGQKHDHKEQGNIVISTAEVDSHVEIVIEDNGTGIPEDIQSRIFDPFFTTKEVGRGTGQGLSIAHSVITEKHSGELFFQSRPGNGTTFTIRLPLANSMA